MKKKSIDTQIAEFVMGFKQNSERYIGYVPYEFKFTEATYCCEAVRPEVLKPLEMAIVRIIYHDQQVAIKRLGSLLGFDVENNPAERSILYKTLNKLREYGAIPKVVDQEIEFEIEDKIELTSDGRSYAEKGERPEKYSQNISVFVDTKHPLWLNIKNGVNVDRVKKVNTPCEDIGLESEQVKAYAQYQYPEIHKPEGHRVLKTSEWIKGFDAFYKVHVCFVQGVKSGEVRAIVYDDNRNGLNELLGKYINDDTTIKEDLLNLCIQLECNNDENTMILEGAAAQRAIEGISQEVRSAELNMVREETEEREVEVKKGVLPSITNKLHKKSLYDSHSFEVELQKMFTKDCPDEIWLVSPWIRKTAFLNDRVPMIENFLQDKKKRVFVAYSKPAANKRDGIMVDEEAEQYIQYLERKYPNFFHAQLPEFHQKNVIEVKGDQKILFSGSFNVLSFSVSEYQKYVRREEMLLAHYANAQKKYTEYYSEFALQYAETIESEIKSMSLPEMLTYPRDRLDYFCDGVGTAIKEVFDSIRCEYDSRLKMAQMDKELSEISRRISRKELKEVELKKVGKRLEEIEKSISSEQEILEHYISIKEQYNKVRQKTLARK